MQDEISTFFSLLIGAIMGSFFTVLIHRIPRKESIIKPASHCPLCGTRLKVIDNIPIVSYIILRGRCRYCGKNINLIYPLVEIVSSILSLVIVKTFGLKLQTLQIWIFLMFLIPLFFIDIKHFILPDSITLPLILWGIIASILKVSRVNPTDAIVGSLICGMLFLTIHILSKGGMGMGDVKLAFAIGANMGLKLGLLSLMIAVCTGALLGLLLIILRKKSRKDKIPFGPFMVIGSYISAFWGKCILDLYIQFLFY